MSQGPGRVGRVGRCLAAVAALLVAATAQAAHPFYEDLLRRGTEDFNRRDYVRAARRLRIACFGLLDEPQLLAEGLTRLALAQAGAGDRAGFADTVRRIEEVEERFAAYTAGSVGAETRTAFEALVVRLLPAATVAASPLFSRLLPPPGELLSQWPPAKRRKELERRIHEEPADVRYRIALAELELGEGRTEAAWAQADAALTLAPGNTYARRLRGRVLAAQGKWVAAAQELLAVGTGDEVQAVQALLLSLVRLERWEEAERLLASLPPAVAADTGVKRLQEAVAARGQP